MQFRLGTLAALVGSVACLLGPAAPARAQIGSDRYSAIVLDNRTGNVLVAASPDETRHPASLTKMMTLYMAFEAIREGRLTLTSAVPISEEAASRPASKIGFAPGASITVEQAILLLVTKSANDVAAALGERLGGSEPRFAQMMTMRARSLGMSRTTFRNASGLPDPDQVTTARDMATLGRRLIQDYPDRYHYFGVVHAQFGGMRIRNHNRMLGEYDGVDGIKTGYIRDSGFNIVTSAMRGGVRVVGAVFGGSSWYERDVHMASLLDQGFAQLGITGRSDMARAPVVLRQAEAAPLSRGPVAGTVVRPAAAAARPPVRTAAARTTATAAATRTARSATTASSAAIPARNVVRPPPRPPATAVRQAAAPARPAATPVRQAAAPARPGATPVRQTTAPASAPPRAGTSRGVTPLPLPAVPVRPADRIRTAELQ